MDDNLGMAYPVDDYPRRFRPPGAVNSRNQNEVFTWLGSQIQAGAIKNCSHLTVTPIEVPGDPCAFIPECKRQSFQWKNFPRNYVEGFESLTQLETNPVRCPGDCLAYQSRLQEALSNKRARVTHFVWSLFSVPVRKFFELPAMTQCFVIALPILAFTPKWVPPIVSLLNALHGK